MGVRKKFIREVAQRVLDEHCPNCPPVKVALIAKRLGIEVKFDSVDDDLSGFLYREPKTGRAVIGVNANHHEHRRTFTIAHELGHFLLHESETVHVDSKKDGYTLQLRNPTSATGANVSEREANLFAAELLMPAKFLAQELRKKDLDLLDDEAQADSVLKSLAKKCGVSLQALATRLHNLGYIK
jgi:Zn-dependent peptidase ImmA (M78 family)